MASRVPASSTTRRPMRLAALLSLGLGLGACSGQVGVGGEAPEESGEVKPPGGGRPPGNGTTPGEPNGGTPGTPNTMTPGMMPPSGSALPLLTCGAKDDGAPGPRIWRLRDGQYKNTVAALLGGRPRSGKLLAPLPVGMSAPFDVVNSADRFSTYAASYSMNEFDFRQAMDAGSDAALRVVAQVKSGGCLASAAMPFADCVRSVLSERGAILFRRPLTKEELDQYAGIAVRSQPMLGSNEEAASLALEAMLLSPYFLFRTELGDGTADAQGNVRLTPYEVAAAVSYSIADLPPDEELWKAAEAKQLGTAAELRPHVERLLGDLSSLSSARRFFREYLRYDHATDVFKDAKDVPFHKPELLEDDTDRWVADVLKTSGRKDLLKQLLTANTGYARKDTATNYGLQTTVKATEPMPVTFPATERAGILTQPSLLAAFSVATDNEPVQRGRFVAESFLCQQVPDLPIGQVPKLPDVGPNFTLRDRLKMHSADPACWACHKMMDPLGLAFEQYDHVGRYRTMLGGKPVDASGELFGTGTGDGAINGVVDMAKKLAASPAVTQCFARHAFRFWMGREEIQTDGCAIVGAQQAFEKSGGDYVELVAALFSSKPFLYRNPSAK